MASSKRTRFINVDLDLESTAPLGPLIEHWGDDVFALRHEGSDEAGYKAGLELSDADPEAEKAILAFVDLVRGLPNHLRATWEALTERKIDVGIQAGSGAGTWSLSLEPSTLAAMESIGVRFVCTIYPPSSGTSTALPSPEP